MTTAPVKPKSTLFDFGSDLIALNDLIEELGGDISDPVVDAAITKWFDENVSDEATKLDGYIGMKLTLEAEAVLARSQVDQFQQKAKSRDARVKFLLERLKYHLQRTNRTKVTTAAGRVISVVKNGGVRPIVWDAAVPVPKDFEREETITVTKTDEAKVRAALERGETLPFAKLAEPGHHIRIK